MLWRQGDILIATISDIPADACPIDGGTLAEGEVTGHRHRFADPSVVQLYARADERFVTIRAPETTIVHEEHRPITLPQGFYRVWRQREYTPQAIRAVID